MSQYNDSYYSGGGGGGGYMAGGSPFSATGSPGGVRRSEIGQSLRPMTICQLNKASQAHTDAEWRVDDMEIGQVTIVAHVVSILPQATNVVYHLDDGSGMIEARHWLDEADTNNGKTAGIEQGTYVRVTGSLKSFGSKRYINTTHVRPITDPHEIFFHILEAMTVSLIVERGPPSGHAAQAKGKDVVMSDTSAYSAPSTSVGQPDQYSHLPKLQQAIVRFMMGLPNSPEGVHVTEIARAVTSTGADAVKISAALDILMDDGLVYTTLDDSHFTLAS